METTVICNVTLDMVVLTKISPNSFTINRFSHIDSSELKRHFSFQDILMSSLLISAKLRLMVWKICKFFFRLYMSHIKYPIVFPSAFEWKKIWWSKQFPGILNWNFHHSMSMNGCDMSRRLYFFVSSQLIIFNCTNCFVMVVNIKQ